MTTAQVAFLWFLGLYWLSAVIAGLVFRVRAGLGGWQRLKISGPGGVGVVWASVTTVKAFCWPLVLAFWLCHDKPEPRILFNDKAAAARARETAEAHHGPQPTARPMLVDPPTTPVRIPAGAPRHQAPPRSAGHPAFR